jgi:hypothetical protein
MTGFDLLFVLAPLVALVLVLLFAFAGCTLDRTGLPPLPPGSLGVTVRFVDVMGLDPAGLQVRILVNVLSPSGPPSPLTRRLPVVRAGGLGGLFEVSTVETVTGPVTVIADVRDGADAEVLAFRPPACAVAVVSGARVDVEIGQDAASRSLVCGSAVIPRAVSIVLFSFRRGTCFFHVLNLDGSPLFPPITLTPILAGTPPFPDTPFQWGPHEVTLPDGNYVVLMHYTNDAGAFFGPLPCAVTVLGPVNVQFHQRGESGPLTCSVSSA